MNRLYQLAIATIIVATPSFASAQGKAQGKAPHGPPPVMGKSAPVRQDNRPEKIADKQQRTAERNADKTERSELKSAHEQKLLTNGIRLTSAEKKQLKAIEKKYDADYRALRKKEVAADNAARKNGTTDSDAAFEAQLSQLKTQER